MADIDTFTTRTQVGWLGRLGGSLTGALIGLLLFVGSFVLLYWNEGRAVDAIVSLNAGAKAVVPVSAASVQPANEGRLIHVSGPVAVSGPLVDTVFHITAAEAIRLERRVEMYQWRETEERRTEKSLGGSETTVTTYRYAKEWSDESINSSGFMKDGHDNPAMAYHSVIFDARGVKLGAFTLDQSQIGQMSHFEILPPKGAGGLPKGFRWVGERAYRGASAENPQVGDLRVGFHVVPVQVASVVARQTGNTLAPFQGLRERVINLVSLGTHSAEEMFAEAKAEEAMLTWILRAVGFVMMLVSVMLMASPLAWLASVLPFLETVVNAASFGVALLVAIPLTLITIALAWLVHRPLIGGALILGAIIVGLGLGRILSARGKTAA